MASRELECALEAARAAAGIATQLYRSNIAVRIKEDRTPVTEADLQCERAIRAVLEAQFPDFGFYGEETGQRAMNATHVWLVDPIDGTKSFVRDTPFFSTQIALRREGKLVLGVSSAPAYGELAWAERGGGAYLNNEPIHVSKIAALAEAILSTGNLKTLAASTVGWRRFGTLVGRVNRLRGYGDFLHYHLLARGALDVVIESDVNILDIAALSVIIDEAGGKFTALDGGDVDLETTTVLAANAALHAPVLAAMRE